MIKKTNLSSNQLRAVLLGAAILLSAVVAVVFASQSQSAPEQPYPLAAPAEAVPAPVSDNLEVFRRPARAGDQAPALPRDRPAAVTGAKDAPTAFGTDKQLSRKVRSTPEGSVYLVAGSRGVCFASTSRLESGCAETGQVVSGNNAQSVICSPYLDQGQRAVYGILPDGATAAQVHFYDGSTQPLQVENNTYEVRTTTAESLPSSISWEDDQGYHEVSSSMPEDANKDRCAQPTVAKGTAQK